MADMLNFTLDAPDVFPWCPTCAIYFLCYLEHKAAYLEEECRFGTVSASYAQLIITAEAQELLYA